MNKLSIDLSQYKQPILVVITIIQIGIMFYYFNIDNKVENIETVKCVMPEKLTFNEINNKLNIDENIEILEMEDLGEKWSVKIMINGNNEKIEELMNNLENIEVYNYDISGKDNILTVILELYS
ncbi:MULTISPECIES: hypothetical protein [unclassified Clostridium]|uniref:hypothetical protein n=1 Tax=Clostridium TaxID=1485 RepID=UPI001C8BC802|nr:MULTISPECIES: hypothetical protein [unclassified Clostridium]MBX9136020.1 hypothetical protein [Clostridium sp. K12(2020)]MBX9142750.1 hypothetical protein [Clostridium sp. K13]MDU2289306.1 hypothetical protein [Clostridium celatum]MDU4327458.1 hypothetical protein [Clostridium celatum]